MEPKTTLVEKERALEMFKLTKQRIMMEIKLLKETMPMIRANTKKEAYICYFPETFLHIGWDSRGTGKPFINAELFAQQFELEHAEGICLHTTNGGNVHPIVIGHVDYYIKLSQWLDARLVDTNNFIKLLEEGIANHAKEEKVQADINFNTICAN